MTTAVGAEHDAAPAREPARVEVFGIRHHGPGSSRSLLAALADYQPDAVLIEGPADADPLLSWAASEQMVPPIALLAYAADRPSVAAFWPYAVFSPEWQALRWALDHAVPVRFCDLPAAMTLGWPSRPPAPPTNAAVDPAADLDQTEPADLELAHPEERSDAGPLPPPTSRDPLALLAAAAGYDDPERWWDDVVESRLDGASPFPALQEAMAALREELGSGGDREARHEARREAYMRQTLRTALKEGRTRVAVVCGAWHAPALAPPLPSAAADRAVLRGAPRRKVTLTWVPWTHRRLASATGYGAGVTSPGWYHHLWTAPDRPIIRWFTKVARSLRSNDLAVSSAAVIEATRLADTLAAVRNRPLAGLAEVTDATRAVLCDGDERAVRFVTEQLVVGEALGSVDPGVPTVPLDADLQAVCRRLRIRREPQPRWHDLDLRRSHDQQKSALFHRLGLLELDWVVPAESEVQGRGTFRETWRSQWRPEHAVALVTAAVWGTTVESAAAAKVDQVAQAGTLAELTTTVERCLRAQLPGARDRLLRALEARAATDTDLWHLMDALPALARAQRYGDVRNTDTGALARVSEVLVARICVGMPRVIGAMNDEGAAALRRRIDAVTTAVALLARAEAGTDLPNRWLTTLAAMVDRPDLHGAIAGRLTRILLDADRLTDASTRLARALSAGVPAPAKAAWVDGFFADGAVLLMHDPVLRGLLDGWVAALGEEEFTALLPLVRRTFASFTPAERQTVAARILHGPAPAAAGEDPDAELAGPAVATVLAILGRGS